MKLAHEYLIGAQYKRYSVYFGITLSLLFGLFYFFTSPNLIIDTREFPTSKSQLFYDDSDGGYSQEKSSIAVMNPANGQFKFSLPAYSDTLRWDPFERSGDFILPRAKLSYLGFTLQVDVNSFIPVYQISSKQIGGGALKFETDSRATDPQVFVKIPGQQLALLRATVAISAAVLCSFLLVMCLIYQSYLGALLRLPIWSFRGLEEGFAKLEFSWKEFVSLFLIAIVGKLILIVNFFVSVDDEVGAFRSDPSGWVLDGRWTAFLVEKFLFPQPVIPYAPNIFFCACLAISYMFLLRANNIKPSTASYLAFIPFSIYPVWWFIEEFYSNIPSAGIGLLVTTVSVFFYACSILKPNGRERIKYIILSALMLAIAIGAYQSFLLMALTMYLGVNLLRVNGEDSMNFLLIKRGVISIGFVVVCGGFCYLAVNKLFQHFWGTRAYVDSFIRIDLLREHPFQIVKLTLGELFNIYSGSAESYGVSLWSSGFVIALLCLLVSYNKKPLHRVVALILIAFTLASPFLLHVFTGAIYLPMRSMLTVSYVFWLAFYIISTSAFRKSFVFCMVLGFFILQIISANSQYAASTMLATRNDQKIADQIYSRIASVNQHFDPVQNIYVDIYGAHSFLSRYPSPPTSTMSASLFDWDGGNIRRMTQFMRFMGYNVYPIPDSERQRNISEFETMPVWPAPGSVKMSGSYYLVKFSHQGDPGHSSSVK